MRKWSVKKKKSLNIVERFNLWLFGVSRHGHGYVMECPTHGVVDGIVTTGGRNVHCRECLEETLSA